MLATPVGLAIDQNGFVFVANNGTGQNVQKFNSSGNLVATFTAASISGPNGISIDAAGDIWVTDFSSSINHLTEFLPSGIEASHSPFSTGFGGVDVAAGPLAVWETAYVSTYVSRVDITSNAVTASTVGGSQGGVAIDHGNNAWLAVTGNGNVFRYSNSGAGTNPFGGFVMPTGSAQTLTVDGLGNIFVGAYVGGSVPGILAEFNNNGVLLSPTAGFSASGIMPVVPDAPEGITVDGSGNVWVAGTNNASSVPNFVTEVIGIAAPVVTPRSVAVTNNTLGVRP